MKKGLLLILFGFTVVILCMSNVQAEIAADYSFDNFAATTGISDFNPQAIDTNNDGAVNEEMILAQAAKKKTAAKKKSAAKKKTAKKKAAKKKTAKKK
jgi:hypothetical protein